MEFRLFYRGPLKANGDKIHKHQIRRQFHPQLKNLWSQSPLKDALPIPLSQSIESLRSSLQVLGIEKPFETIGDCNFFPLIRKDFNLIAQLEIILLRPEEPGAIITQGGDIDNRIKTLFDALRMPKAINELPPNYVPDAEENPLFYCLLQDDALITAVTVIADRLLLPCEGEEVILLVKTRILGTKSTWINEGITG